MTKMVMQWASRDSRFLRTPRDPELIFSSAALFWKIDPTSDERESI